MAITIENNKLKISIKTKGAELCNVVHKETGLEYMWSGDPAVWGKTSPVLFPIVGTLRDDTFIYEGKSYQLPRHGFARDVEFEIKEQNSDCVVFLLRDTEASRQKYPFSFELTLTYSLNEDTLHVAYGVKNNHKEVLYFSIGAHPAFKAPLTDNTRYEDYYLQFSNNEDARRWPISKTGLIEHTSIPFFKDTNRIALTRSIFESDALVFKHLKSDKVSLKCDKHNHGLDFYMNEFPFLGIWAAKGGDFVCIEPWCGIADSVDHNQQFISKEGVEKLEGNASWKREWKVRFY